MVDASAFVSHRASDGSRRAAPACTGRGRYPPQRCYAALDLGTNNCRLLIARPEGEGFAVVDAFSRIVRLGEGLAASGRLSEVAIDRALAALWVCSDKLMRRNVHLSRSVATEACRRASNGAAFVDRVYNETGIALDIIAPEEEARLAVLGCHTLLAPGNAPSLIFDIGGGSTEVVLIDTHHGCPRTIDWLSIPWGVVSLSEAEPDAIGPDNVRLPAYGRMRKRVSDGLAEFASRCAPHGPTQLLGTSGTVTTLGSVHLGLEVYDRRQIDGLVVPSMSMRAICTRLSTMSLAGRAELPCIGQERADLVVAGCAILEAILDLWPIDQVGIADRGIREGILRGLMQSGARQ
jgi:exopolyphosphatase / guanosine-5'-triphosphate,3'-diphosphate pyrophosphatase